MASSPEVVPVQLSENSIIRIQATPIGSPVDDVSVVRNLALIMIVGEGMRRTIGLASKATTALANANVNIEMINQGSSELSMMFGIKEEDEKTAIKALYDAFFGSK